ncbi:adenylosuccinate lyase [PVC group bacterium]|nr:adenylosuccinate lyase [PVC group bacterium]
MEMRHIWDDDNRFRAWLLVEVYACEAHAKLGNIPQKSLRVIKKKAKFTTKRIHAIEKTVQHDVIAFLTSVAEHVGPDSRFIHMGMTSSDVLDTALSYQMKQSGEILIKDLKELIQVLTHLSRKYKNTVIMGRSHGVHAEPTTFGLKMAVFLAEGKRNLERLQRAVDTISYGKISGAVGTYAHIDPSIEKYVCKKMGLKPAPISTQIIQRDRHAEFISVLAIIASSLDKIATEIRHLQRTEVSEVQESFSKGQKGSSAMPHKKNPIVCERISGLARVLRGHVVPAMENIPLWHERDITHSSVERVIIPDSTILLDYMLKKSVGLLKNLIVYEKKMKENIDLSYGLPSSQQVLLAFIKKGLTREKAYKIVQAHAMKAWDTKLSLKDLLMKDSKVRKILTQKEITECFDLHCHTKHASKIIERVIKL